MSIFLFACCRRITTVTAIVILMLGVSVSPLPAAVVTDVGTNGADGMDGGSGSPAGDGTDGVNGTGFNQQFVFSEATDAFDFFESTVLNLGSIQNSFAGPFQQWRLSLQWQSNTTGDGFATNFRTGFVAVPEPGSIILVAAVSAAGWVRRRRQPFTSTTIRRA